MHAYQTTTTLLITSLLMLQAPAYAWRSILYPDNWTPATEDSQGRFLHDFSYAGYRNGSEKLPLTTKQPVINAVKDFSADNTGAADATSAIQQAIDQAGRTGSTVFLPEGLYRCDGILKITKPGTIIRGAGPEKTRVFLSKHQDMRGKSHITFQGSVKDGPDIKLVKDAKNLSFSVTVRTTNGLSVGDDISVGWVITDDFISRHNMTGTWKSFNGKWRPFFRRTITGISKTGEDYQVHVDVPLRYDALIKDQASIRKETGYLTECGIADLAISNAVNWNDAWSQARVHIIGFRNVKDCWASNIKSFASPLPGAKEYHVQDCGILVVSSKRVTISDCRMEKAQNRGSGGCGYLFEISSSNEILTRDCQAVNGRHNFIQNWDFGTTGCVWLRCHSKGSAQIKTKNLPIPIPADCEYHHSLTMACLVDQCILEDGWYGGNRRDWSSGAGITVTQSVYWNTGGGGRIRSWQYGNGYIIGTDDIKILTGLGDSSAKGTEPVDYIEGPDKGRELTPQSLYEDQLKQRLKLK